MDDLELQVALLKQKIEIFEKEIEELKREQKFQHDAMSKVGGAYYAVLAMGATVGTLITWVINLWKH
jgi:hypothetical protein